ncbi:putative methanogenesis regulatory protein FilR2 [uncultured archaeon]|nr:putative methanogenesis regulatory protein FilR2 [uncultured archaeon]
MTNVLVVEDDPLNMELVCEILRSTGFIVHEATNGKEAIEKTGKQLYDLIVMDIMLPGMDGIEATRIIKRKPGYEKIPVIALTAYAMKGDRERLLEEGFDDYVPKPVDVSEFMRIIEKYKV